MKKSLITLLFTLCSIAVFGQNLVRNPGFEFKFHCPGAGDILDVVAHPWQVVQDFPRLFDTCWVGAGGLGIPHNVYGYQEERRDKGAFAGIENFVAESTSDIIEGRLNAHMFAGNDYYITMWVNLADSSPALCTNLGMNFYPDSNNAPNIGMPPDLIFDMSQVDTGSWTKVQGIFKPDTNMLHVQIGNFLSSSQSDTIHLWEPNNPNYFSYLFIDDVCISPSAADCEYDFGVGFVEPVIEDCKYEYYDLYGRKQSGPVAGFNLRRCGDSWTKVWISK